MSRQRAVRHARRQMRHVLGPEALEDRRLLAWVISEINYEPYAPVPQFGETAESANDFEFIELLNAGPEAVNMQGMRLVQTTVDDSQEGVLFTFGAVTLAANQRIVIVRDLDAFGSRYGTNVRVAGEWTGGNLANSGEQLTLVDATNTVLVQMTYDSNSDWPSRAAGLGPTLEIKDVTADPNDPDNWRSSREYGGTPGTESQEPRDPTVLINEVLAHTDLPQVDTVEFHNLTDAAIDMSGWYFTDSAGDPFRFRLSTGSIIPANGYLTIDEGDFNPGGATLPNDFAISELGEPLKLISVDAEGRPRLLEDYVEIGPTANGVSVGNVMEIREGSELRALAGLTLGAANQGHRVAEAVISEIQYHSPDDDVNKEFIELQNTTVADLALDEWTIQDSPELTIPAGTVLKPGEAVVLVAFDPANPLLATAFREYYEIDGTVRLIGPWSTNNSGEPQSLSNNGEKLLLRSPLVELDEVYLAWADEVDYNDSAPWPLVADGEGGSLARVDLTKYGNLPESWQGTRPSPGNQPIDYSNAPMLELAVPLPGELGRDGQLLRGTTDVDVFRFRPDADGMFEFRTQAIGAAAQTALRVFNADQEELAFSNQPTGSTENRVNVAVQAGTDYYVVVSGSSEAAQQYDPFTGAGLVSSAAAGSYTITVQGVVNLAPWQNVARPTDVDNSGAVVPLDALLVINQLNTLGSIALPAPAAGDEPPPYIDVNGDNFLSPLDALLVINELNAAAEAAAEGEPLALSLVAAAVDDAWALDEFAFVLLPSGEGDRRADEGSSLADASGYDGVNRFGWL